MASGFTVACVVLTLILLVSFAAIVSIIELSDDFLMTKVFDAVLDARIFSEKVMVKLVVVEIPVALSAGERVETVGAVLSTVTEILVEVA